MTDYKDYEIQYELADELNILNKNNTERSKLLQDAKKTNATDVVENYVEEPVNHEEYTATDYTVKPIASAKSHALRIFQNRWRFSAEGLGVPTVVTKMTDGGVMYIEVATTAEFDAIFNGATINRNRVIVIKLTADITVASSHTVQFGTSIIIDLNGFTLTANTAVFFTADPVSSNQQFFNFICMFGGTFKIHAAIPVFYFFNITIDPLRQNFFFPEPFLMFYDILNMSVAADKKLYIDLNNINPLTFIFAYPFAQFNFHFNSAHVNFINRNAAVIPTIAPALASSCSCGKAAAIVDFATDYDLISNALQVNFVGGSNLIPSNIMFSRFI